MEKNFEKFIRIGCSGIHGTGAFALVDIPAGKRVIEYRGEKISKEESLKRCEMQNQFIFTLNDHWDLDGSVEWNPARFINHSCNPNCESDVVRGKVWIKTLRAIKAGEELTYNYGFDLESYKDYPCRCGAANCVGFIVAEEHAEHVRKMLAVAKEAAQI